MAVVLVVLFEPSSPTKDRLSRTMECLPMPDNGGGFVFYNRIPKCGSTSTMMLFREESKEKNSKYHLVRATNAEYKPEHPWEPNTEYTDQWKALKQLIQVRSRRERIVYVNHVLWPNFTNIVTNNDQNFAAINVMRDPISRYISGYYYLMYGPRDPTRILSHQSYMMKTLNITHLPDINEFILRTQNFSSCSRHPYANKQIEYFCGFDPVCKDPCSKAALHRAKYIMATQYDAVGVLERYPESLRLFEKLLPTFYEGLAERFINHKKTRARITPSEEKVMPTKYVDRLLRAQNSPDIELYNFAVQLLKEKLAACGIASVGVGPGRDIH